MQHPISNNYYIYYFLPIVACAYLTLFQYSLLDFNVGLLFVTTTTTNTTTTAAVATNTTNTTTVINTTLDDHLHHVTGSFANCTANRNRRTRTRRTGSSRLQQFQKDDRHLVQGTTRISSSSIATSSFTISIATSNHTTGTTTSTIPQDFIGTVLVSCQTISFRIPASSFLSWSLRGEEMVQEGKNDHVNHNHNSNHNHNGPQIITGVLSSAMGDLSKQRRQSIRNTWAQRSNTTTTSSSDTGNTGNTTGNTRTPLVYFLLAGPWENVQDEYYTHQDILWIDEEEVYNGEQSVLTLKTYSFFQIIYAIVQEYHVPVTHLFKTDDDSYVNLHALVQELQESSLQQNSPSSSSSSSLPMVDGRHDYFGQCQFKYPKVHRESDYKWPITNETYPEPWFPRYCQGAGFGISLHFLTCAAGRGHISNIRFMPFEDVAVGMLAERCGVDPQRPVTAKVKVFRYQSDEVKKRTRLGDTRTDDLVPPAACMMNKIVQHRIIDEYDMEEHHKTVLDPLYCNVTRVKRDQLIQQMKEKGIEWFG